MLVNEARRVVDLVVDDNEQVLLRVVVCHLGVSVLHIRHFESCEGGCEEGREVGKCEDGSL